MKIIKRITAIAVASSILIAAMPKAQANPAVLAPAALRGTGVGCVLVASVVIAGTVYYVWEYGGGKQVLADAAGQIFRSDYLEEPGDFNKIEQHESSGTRSESYAEKKCRQDARGRKYLRKYQDNFGYWVCVYR